MLSSNYIFPTILLLFVKVSMVLKHHLSSQLFDNHLTYCETESDTILVDIILDIELCEHFSNYIGILKTYAFITHNNLKGSCR